MVQIHVSKVAAEWIAQCLDKVQVDLEGREGADGDGEIRGS